MFASFYSMAFRCADKLLVWDHFNFSLKAWSAMNFPLNSPFFVSNKFGYDVSSFPLKSI